MISDFNLYACAECGGDPDLVGGWRIYPHRPDLHRLTFWQCPDCGAYVGSHKHTGEPLGRPAGPETRKARSVAHAVFDQLWRGPGSEMSRSQAYRWLRATMGLSEPEGHIAMMTAEQARRLVTEVNKRSFSKM